MGANFSVKTSESLNIADLFSELKMVMSCVCVFGGGWSLASKCELLFYV